MTGNSHHCSASPIWLPSVMSPMDVGRAVVLHPDLQQKHAYRVDGQPTMEVKNGADCCPQTLVVNDLKSRRWPAASGVPRGLLLETILFCLTHPGDVIECTLIDFADDTKLNDGGRMGAGQPKTWERAPIQLDLDWVE